MAFDHLSVCVFLGRSFWSGNIGSLFNSNSGHAIPDRDYHARNWIPSSPGRSGQCGKALAAYFGRNSCSISFHAASCLVGCNPFSSGRSLFYRSDPCRISSRRNGIQYVDDDLQRQCQFFCWINHLGNAPFAADRSMYAPFSGGNTGLSRLRIHCKDIAFNRSLSGRHRIFPFSTLCFLAMVRQSNRGDHGQYRHYLDHRVRCRAKQIPFRASSDPSFLRASFP